MKRSSVFWILVSIGITIQSIFTFVFFITAKHFSKLHKFDWIPVFFLGALCAVMLKVTNYLLKK